MAEYKRLIDANALIEKATLRHGYDFQGVFVKVQDIEAAPTVDAVEVVHGWWIHNYYDSGEPIDDRWYCSECHMCNDHRRTWYCPNCGAKMDGDVNDC